MSILCEIGEFRIDRKSECLDFFRGNFGSAQHVRAEFIRNKKIIRVTSVPDSVNRDRVGYDNNILVTSTWSRDLIEQMGISRKDGRDDVRLKGGKQVRQVLLRLLKSREVFVEVSFVIEPAINVAPGARPVVDQSEIRFANEFVECAKSFGEEIAHFDACIRRHPGEAVAHSAGGGVVTLAVTRGQDQNSFHKRLNEGA